MANYAILKSKIEYFCFFSMQTNILTIEKLTKNKSEKYIKQIVKFNSNDVRWFTGFHSKLHKLGVKKKKKNREFVWLHIIWFPLNIKNKPGFLICT